MFVRVHEHSGLDSSPEDERPLASEKKTTKTKTQWQKHFGEIIPKSKIDTDTHIFTFVFSPKQNESTAYGKTNNEE